MSDCCSNCKFWHRKSAILTDPGVCRRNPPTTAIVALNGPNMETRSFFPTCTSEHWCGEHKRKLMVVGSSDPFEVLTPGTGNGE